MKLLDRYLGVSTIHGVRYLSSTNGALIRLMWFMVVLAAFFICGILVYENAADNAKHPVSSSISSVPISSMPFPSITTSDGPLVLAPSSMSVSAGLEEMPPLLERVLNHFFFDCSSAGFIPGRGFMAPEEARECERKSKKVKDFFEPILNIVMNVRMKAIRKRIRNLGNEVSVGQQLLCGHAIFQEYLRYQASRLVWRNDTLNLYRELQDILKATHLLPYDTGPMAAGQRVEVLDRGNEPEERESCYLAVSHAETDTVTLLSAFMATVGSDTARVPLGSFLKPFYANIAYTTQLMGMMTVEDKLMRILLDKLNIEVPEEFLANMTCIIHGHPTYCLHYQQFRGAADHKMLNDILSLFLDRMTLNAKALAFYAEVAAELADQLGLGADVLLPLEESVVPPRVWYCKYMGRIVEDCFNFDLVYTSDGMGHTLNLGEWKDSFGNIPNPYVNTFFEDKSLQLNGRDEIFMFVQGNADG